MDFNALPHILKADDADALERMLVQGLDPRHVDSEGRPLALRAAGALAWRCLELLAVRGADLDARDFAGRTPAMAAVARFSREDGSLGSLLLAAMETFKGQSTPEATLARERCVEVLARHGADFAARDRDGMNAFHHAAGCCHLPRMESALPLFAHQLDALDALGQRPAHLAMDVAGLEFLALHGADLDALDHAGESPAARAGRRGRVECARFIDAWTERGAIDAAIPAANPAPRSSL